MSRYRMNMLISGIPSDESLGAVYTAIDMNCWSYDVQDVEFLEEGKARLDVVVKFEEPVYIDGKPSFEPKTPADIEEAIDGVTQGGCDIIEQEEC